jgi:hypothetical protein
MQIYITKNNQQSGPFAEEKVLEMLSSGELAPSDLAIRQGEQQWRKLGELYPQSAGASGVKAAVATATSATPAPKKSRKGLLLGCGGFLLLSLLVSSVLGFIGYRNMFPADSLENLPATVGTMKLDNRYPPKGNIWGTETTYVGLYSNESKTETVIYMMTVFSSDEAAKTALREGLVRTCQSGEKPMNFTFVDTKGATLSEGSTCAVPLYVQKDNRLAAIGGSGSSAEIFIEFAENLPFNKGAKMKKKE